jgi:hypothetical protein
MMPPKQRFCTSIAYASQSGDARVYTRTDTAHDLPEAQRRAIARFRATLAGRFASKLDARTVLMREAR